MTTLILMQGQNLGRRFTCDGDTITIGRQADCAVCLDDPAVSRRHARLLHSGQGFLIEDLGSSNGTYVNGIRVAGRHPLTESDTLQIGPYVLALRVETEPPTPKPDPTESDPIIRSQVSALSSNASLFSQNAAHKLQVVVEIAQSLGRTLEVETLLDKLLEQLFRLFPQAERGLVILGDKEPFSVRAQRQRHQKPADLPGSQDSRDFAFSRSIVRRALDEGAGLLSEDVTGDPNVSKTATLMALNLRSFLCVPLIGLDGRRLGVLQLDCVRQGLAFKHDDLELLAAVSLQVASVLENAALHEERLREERFKQELALAREIQQSFLPNDFRPLDVPGYELYAECLPAREMSGDLYDFFARPDGKLAVFLGDVSGKGMPSALFMIAARTLIRHLASSTGTPGETLLSLNNALFANNPTSLYVTLAHATFDPSTGEVVVASGGHPAPLWRRVNGKTETVEVRSAMMLGYDRFDRPPPETKLTLGKGELLAFYSDGLSEAMTAKRDMFGVERLQQVLAGPYGRLALPECAAGIGKAIAEFTHQAEPSDDRTLLLLRRT